MSKKTQVLVRNEHMATKKESFDHYGLGEAGYAQFCANIEACRNEKGRWDYNKFVKFAESLVGWKADEPELPPLPEGYDFSQFLKTEEEINTYKREHDPLHVNPWVVDDNKKD